MNTKKFNAICQGFKNYVFPSESFELLAKERAKICSSCEHLEPRMEFRVFDLIQTLYKNQEKFETKEIIKGAGCKVCKCYLAAKTRQVLEDCPENKW